MVAHRNVALQQLLLPDSIESDGVPALVVIKKCI